MFKGEQASGVYGTVDQPDVSLGGSLGSALRYTTTTGGGQLSKSMQYTDYYVLWKSVTISYRFILHDFSS